MTAQTDIFKYIASKHYKVAYDTVTVFQYRRAKFATWPLIYIQHGLTTNQIIEDALKTMALLDKHKDEKWLQ